MSCREQFREQVEEFSNSIGAMNVDSVAEEVVVTFRINVWYGEGYEGQIRHAKFVSDE